MALPDPADALCLIARLLAEFDGLALRLPPARFKGKWRPCRAPCGEGIYRLNKLGGFSCVSSAWCAGIEALCHSVSLSSIGDVALHYEPYGWHGRRSALSGAVSIDIQTVQGVVRLGVSVNPQGDPMRLERHDLPLLCVDGLGPDGELEFWMANQADCLCLVSQLLSAIGPMCSLVLHSLYTNMVPSVRRQRHA